ncbi:hypothetical protein ACPSX2_22120, partial [Escherichia coli]|uniref:hypothetical protein n=1 Tax=Escherichia coli TaxID=562 RepID=UPI003CE7733E
SPMTSLKTSIKTITYLSDIGCLEIQGASLLLNTDNLVHHTHVPGENYFFDRIEGGWMSKINIASYVQL